MRLTDNTTACLYVYISITNIYYQTSTYGRPSAHVVLGFLAMAYLVLALPGEVGNNGGAQ